MSVRDVTAMAAAVAAMADFQSVQGASSVTYHRQPMSKKTSGKDRSKVKAARKQRRKNNSR